MINMSDMNIVNDEISRLLMRSNGENATFECEMRNYQREDQDWMMSS